MLVLERLKKASLQCYCYILYGLEILAYLSHQIFSKWKTVLVSLSPHLTTTPTPNWTTLTKCPLTLLDPWLQRQTVDPRLTSPFESSPWWPSLRPKLFSASSRLLRLVAFFLLNWTSRRTAEGSAKSVKKCCKKFRPFRRFQERSRSDLTDICNT